MHTPQLTYFRRKSISYIFYEATNGKQYGFIIDKPIKSQFVRRLICEELQQPEIWDWEIFPYREETIKFNSEYARYLYGLK
jgi:hypothetical protein